MLNLTRHLIRHTKPSTLTLHLLQPIFVESFPTPNPNYLKFVPQQRTVLGQEGTLDISDPKFAESPLFRNLFPGHSSCLVPKTLANFSTSIHFAKGNDSRQLSPQQQRQISDFVGVDQLSSSILVYNPTEALRKLTAWKRALPWIKPHYAIKSCPAEELISDLAASGTGMDCASKAQIETSLQAGVALEDIVYSNPIKNERDLIWAAKTGVKLTTADSIDQLTKIRQYAPQMDVLWRIAIKEQARDNLATPFSGKFGDDLETDDMIQQRMEEIAGMDVNLKGIHFHCGSGMHGSSAFGKAVRLARKCMQIGRAQGHEMRVLDVGGGFPAGDLSDLTVQALKPTERDPMNYQVIAEPGRHFSSRCFYLLTRILGKRTKNNKPCFHLNQSVYHSFNCTLMDGVSFQNSNDQFYSKLTPQGHTPLAPVHNSTLFGMTCDGMDIIAKNIGVPADAQVGDWFCFGGMGAYTHGCKSNFNGMVTTEKTIRWATQVQQAMIERKYASNLA